MAYSSYYVFSGVVSSGVNLFRDSMYVSSGGSATSTTVSSGGLMRVHNGGTATETTVSAGGDMDVIGGGTATETTVSSGGSMRVYGTATATTVSAGGDMDVYNGGTATETTVSSGGYLDVSSSGTATSTTVSAGGRINGFIVQQENYYSSGIHVSNAYVSGYAYLYSDQTATATTVSAGGDMDVYNGGTATETTVSSGGSMRVYGTATETTVNPGGSMWVDGTAWRTMINPGGSMWVSNGGRASIAFSPWIRGYVSSASGADVTYLKRDANVYWGNDNSGVVGKGDAAEDIIISSGVSMLIYSSGAANATTVSAGGWMYVSSGGTATGTMINPGGSMTISSGGTASILFNPWMGTVNSMTGASVAYLERDMNVYFGGGSAGLLERGDTLSNVNVTSGLRTIIYSGGALDGASLESWGEMYVFSGGRVTGELNVEQGALVSAYRGSLIDFDLSDRSSDSGALINDLTLINGVPDYAVTVSATQTAGTYRLAEGAEFFTGSITVKDAANESYGVLAVGETLTVSGVDYQLNLADGLLSFTVGGNAPVPPVTGTSAKSDVNGNGVSDVLFQYTGGDNQLGFWLDGTDNWQGQGIPESADWDVIGAYDMSSDGKADVVMLGNVTVSGIRGAFVGYRKNGDMSSWENISAGQGRESDRK